MKTSFIEALRASGPAPEHAAKLHLFGQFVGSWEAEATAFLPDGATRRHYWQIHFDWALEGRAIQDVWITPPRNGPNVGKSQRWGPYDNQYGTSIRVYDPKIDAWRTTWIDPCAGFRADLIGRPRNGEIFQEGIGSDGTRQRWIFSDIAPDRFRWRAEISSDDGASWHKGLEMLGHRI
jgi:hypothetical protein